MKRARSVPHAVSIGALVLAVAALAAGARSQQPSACEQRCRASEQQRTRCADDRCRREASLQGRRCALDCNTTMSEIDRCRARCDIMSDECDLGCRSRPDERGCLRRCGSQYHISCPEECPGGRGGSGPD